MEARVRNPASFGTVHGPGIVPACKHFPLLEEEKFIEISFQLTSDSHGIVGYADMNLETGENVLHHLYGAGDRFDIRCESALRELNLGDFAIHLDSENDRAVVTAKW